MPQKAAFNPERKQALANSLRRAVTQAFSTRNHLRYHLCMSEPLYKKANETLLSLVELEKQACRELDLPAPTFEGVTEGKWDFDCAARIIKGERKGLIP